MVREANTTSIHATNITSFSHPLGIIQIEDAVDKELKPYFFVLTQTRLSYIDYKPPDEQEEDNEDRLSLSSREDLAEDELHIGEKWFHGKLYGKRTQAEQLLKQYSHLGDGTFLVRESDTFVGDYSLSFWHDGKPNHCRIRSCIVNGKTKYYFIEKVTFDSLYALITFYQSNPLKSLDFTVKLQVRLYGYFYSSGLVTENCLCYQSATITRCTTERKIKLKNFMLSQLLFFATYRLH